MRTLLFCITLLSINSLYGMMSKAFRLFPSTLGGCVQKNSLSKKGLPIYVSKRNFFAGGAGAGISTGPGGITVPFSSSSGGSGKCDCDYCEGSHVQYCRKVYRMLDDIEKLPRAQIRMALKDEKKRWARPVIKRLERRLQENQDTQFFRTLPVIRWFTLEETNKQLQAEEQRILRELKKYKN